MPSQVLTPVCRQIFVMMEKHVSVFNCCVPLVSKYSVVRDTFLSPTLSSVNLTLIVVYI